MFTHRWLMLVVFTLSSSLVACGERTPAPPAAASEQPSAVSEPQTSIDAEQTAGQEPSATPGPSPTRSPRERLAQWSGKPRRIFSEGCGSVVATIDDSSRFHVAAICDDAIRFATSTNGRSWKASALPPSSKGFDLGLQLAADGSTLYLAYTHHRPVEADTCGGPPIPDIAGIYYRTRTLPEGAWSRPTRIGHEGDDLQSFRVVGGVIHWTFMADNGQGPVSYASQRGSTYREIRIPGAEQTALRIGDDGQPRIAYTNPSAVRYATINGSRISSGDVFAADDVNIGSPVLVLGRDDHAYLAWSAVPRTDPGCSEASIASHEGTWFATNADGQWTTKRLSKDVAPVSLALDVVTGRLHAIYADRRGIRYVTRSSDGVWSGSRLATQIELQDPVLRRDPASGLLLLVGSGYMGDSEPAVFALAAP
jgi:hypothetical protein